MGRRGGRKTRSHGSFLVEREIAAAERAVFSIVRRFFGGPNLDQDLSALGREGREGLSLRSDGNFQGERRSKEPCESSGIMTAANEVPRLGRR